MSWVALHFQVDASSADALAGALLDQGALSVDVSDAEAGSARETPVFGEPGAEHEEFWRRNRMSALFPTDSDHAAALQTACAAAGVPMPAEWEVEPVADQDWVRATQDQFGPIEISKRLWIVPSWSAPPVASAITLRLDPGLAFGTGSHPTTRQCLQWLDEHLPAGASVLDYGCGSGILAIAAKKLGAGDVIGTDIDRNAVDASRGNAQRNGVAVEFVLPDALPERRFDVVLANILANPLRVLAPLLVGRARTGGEIVLAGILESQAQAVTEAYAPWSDLTVTRRTEGWACLTGTRKPD